MANVLMIDDDEELCELVADYLRVEGFDVRCVHDGASGVETFLKNEFDVAILDVMLPKLNGFDALKRIRETSQKPVLMLTARGDEMEKIVGLEIGADDYLSKPFNPRELVARLRAILRRTKTAQTKTENDSKILEESQNELKIDDVTIDVAARTAKLNDKILSLTAVEFELLVCFLKQAAKVIERDDLCQKTLGRKLSPFDRSLDMHVSNLRRKLGKRSDNQERIKTIRSIGYIYTINNSKL
ncbi:MAG: response regulator transcription factor [Pyrinomonadaceae bacterium]|nr:response regulator transcription factor [Pyrinomonadaceae bacterium]